MSVMPMFPLGSVLFPGGVLPLHVFEPRYRELVQDCLADETHEFGVVLIQRGSEVGGGDVRGDCGVVARMVQVAEMPDGRYAVIAVGVRRFRVVAWLPDDPYPVADVDDWPDATDDAAVVDAWSASRIAALAQRVRRASALAMELGDQVYEPGFDLDDQHELASYQLSAAAPLSSHDRFRLLGAHSATDRLTMLELMLGDVEAVLQFRLHTDATPLEGLDEG
jgi:uncharacterized protein